MAVGFEGFYTHSGTEVGAAYADVDKVGNGFVGDASVAAVVECFGVSEGTVEFVVEFGEDVFAVNVNGRGIRRQALGGMEDGAVFAEVDFFAVLHGVHLSGKGRGFGKAAQKLQSVFAEAVFAVIEEKAVEGFVHIAEAVGFGGEAVAQVEVLCVEPVLFKGLPCFGKCGHRVSFGIGFAPLIRGM